MATELYSLDDVISVAKIHPFYVPGIQYPPDQETIQAARESSAKEQVKAGLVLQPILRKKDLYTTIGRLVDDPSPKNAYRDGIYASITGGGSGSLPVFFATDVHENRRQRAYLGQLIRKLGLIERGDWVVTTHCEGHLYRSLDLILELLENAGASVLSAGDYMSPSKVVQLIIKYHVNVLSGDSGQIVRMVHHISTLSPEERSHIKITKIIYTSEMLTVSQKAHIKSVLGDVKICSIMGSAEAGAWAVSSPDIIEANIDTSHADFVFDTRTMLIEILDPSLSEDDCVQNLSPLPDGQRGIIVQTSLSRLRNPLVRYVTGDVGSLHSLPKHAEAVVSEDDRAYLRVLRLEGRDKRFSFDWDGDYIDFGHLTTLLNQEECGILQWQVILDKMEPSLESSLEFRLLLSPRDELHLSQDLVIGRIRTFVHAYPTNEHRFKMTIVHDLNGFERSSTGRKVIKFVNRYND